MKEFKFEDRTRQIKIGDTTYSVCVSNYEFMQKAQTALGSLTEAQEKFEQNANLENLMFAINKFVNLMFGGAGDQKRDESEYDYLWNLSGHDVYGMLDLCMELASFVKEGMEYKVEKYLQPSN